MVGACLLWVGWFGFNAGSNLESNALTALGLPQHHHRHCGGGARLDRSASGSTAAIRACSARRRVPSPVSLPITPACGWVGPGGAIVIGLAAGFICLWAVVWLKAKLGYDDSLDVLRRPRHRRHCRRAFDRHLRQSGAGRRGRHRLSRDRHLDEAARILLLGARSRRRSYAVVTALILSGVVCLRRPDDLQGRSPACGSASRTSAKASTSPSMGSAPTTRPYVTLCNLRARLRARLFRWRASI